MRYYRKGIDSLEAFIPKYQIFESFLSNPNIYNPNTFFCSVNNYDSAEGSRLLELYLKPYPIPKHLAYRFLVEKFWCLTEQQKNSIERTLRTSLKPTDPYFHQLISLYQVDFSDFLATHVPEPSQLRAKIEAELRYKNRISEETQFLIKNMAASSNHGEEYIEDTLLNIVHSIYRHIKDTQQRHWLISFYHDIMDCSVVILNSRSAIRETLYLLDEDDRGYFGDDVGPANYAEIYFYNAIAPKLKDRSFDHLFRPGHEDYIEKLKERIMNDDSIWYDHIK